MRGKGLNTRSRHRTFLNAMHIVPFPSHLCQGGILGKNNRNELGLTRRKGGDWENTASQTELMGRLNTRAQEAGRDEGRDGGQDGSPVWPRGDALRGHRVDASALRTDSELPSSSSATSGVGPRPISLHG